MSKCPKHVECALYPPYPVCRAPAIRRLRVLLYVVQIFHLSDFVPARQTWYHKRVRYYIHMLNHYAKTQHMTGYENAQPWRTVHLWWFMYVCFIYLFDRRSVHEIRRYQSKLLPMGEHFHVPLNVLEEEQKPTAMPRAMKNEIFIHHNPKAKYPGIK